MREQFDLPMKALDLGVSRVVETPLREDSRRVGGSLAKISVTILCKDSEKTLQRTLDSLEGFGEILVYDTGSRDRTREIALSYQDRGVTLHEGPFEGFGPSHNRASALCKYDWVLSIDSDEWLSPSLKAELDYLDLDNILQVGCVRRRNYYRGRWIKGCGWWPDWQKKLYNRLFTRFDDALVHEAIIDQGAEQLRLHGLLCHEPYREIGDFLSKLQAYTQLYATMHRHQRGRISISKAIGHGFFAFFRSYFLRRGWLLGYEGWLISIYNGHQALYKYLRVYEYQLRGGDDLYEES